MNGSGLIIGTFDFETFAPPRCDVTFDYSCHQHRAAQLSVVAGRRIDQETCIAQSRWDKRVFLSQFSIKFF